MESDPIVVFGAGRSGSTVFHQMLSTNSELSWLSSLSDRFPRKIYLHRILMQATSLPVLDEILPRRFPPSEAYAFWECYCKGFSTPCRDLLPEDVSDKIKNRMQNVFSAMTTENKRRLLLKITGWPRVGFLSEIFENAKFIHVIRDGRAVANSLINVEFWRGWGGPDKWRWGPLSAEHSEEWHAHDRSFIALAAIQWKIHMDAAENARKHVKDSNLLEIKYEDLCADPIAMFKEVARFCNLAWAPAFESRLRSFPLKNTNNKWERELNERQKSDLVDVLNDYLRRYDYT